MTRTVHPSSGYLPYAGTMRETPGPAPAFEGDFATNAPDAAGVRRSITHQLIAAMARRPLLVAAATAGGIVAGVLVAGILPVRHDAAASLYVGFDRAHIVRDDVTGTDPWIPFRLDTVMLGELEILRSPALREAVLDTVGLERLEDVPDAAANAPASDGPVKSVADWLRARLPASEAPATPEDRRDLALIDLERGLEVTRSVDSPVIQITYRHRDPDVARDVVAAAIDAYRAQRGALFAEGAHPEVLGELAIEARKRVEAAEAALGDFRVRAGLLAEDAQAEADAQRIRALEEAAAEALRTETELAASLDVLSGPQGAHLAIDLSEAARLVGERRRDLEIERTRLLILYEADAEPVLLVDQEIEALDGLAAEATEAAAAQTRSRMLAHRERRVAIEGELDRLVGQLARAEADRTSIRTLELDLELARTAYEHVVARRDEVRLSAALDSSGVTSIRTLQPPAVAPYSSSTSPAALGAVGGVLGLAAGALLASLAGLASRPGRGRGRAHAEHIAAEKVHG